MIISYLFFDSCTITHIFNFLSLSLKFDPNYSEDKGGTISI